MSARRLQASCSCSGAGLDWLCCGFSRFQIPARAPLGSLASAGAAALVPAPANDPIRQSATIAPADTIHDGDRKCPGRLTGRHWRLIPSSLRARTSTTPARNQSVPLLTRCQRSWHLARNQESATLLRKFGDLSIGRQEGTP